MKTKKKLKASFKIWLIIYPAITVFLYLFGGILAALPLYIRTLIITLSLVPLIVFAGLPALDKMIALWGNGANKENLNNG